MQHCDTLILADWCIPVEPHDTVLAGHAIAVNDGRIVEVLPSREARKKYEPGVLVERPGHAVIPAASRHIPVTLSRTNLLRHSRLPRRCAWQP
jgi:5-methylthioadenosine/S-adenosylhomocysteine deaminase